MKPILLHYIAVFYLICLIPGVSGVSPDEWTLTSQGNFSSLEKADVDAVIEPLIYNQTYPGIVVSLVDENGYVIYSYGVGNRISQIPVDNRTIFQIGSVSKTFTGLLLADAEIRGFVNLSAPVSQYLPETIHVPSYQGREITVTDLATHTSGLPNVPERFYQYIKSTDPKEEQAESTFFSYAEMTADEGYLWLSNQSLNRSPGLFWDYSNFGSAMAGNISSRMQNTSYGDLLESAVFVPLAMNSSSTVWTPEVINRAATGYRMYAPAQDEGKIIRFNDFWVACGGILSDGDDMARYVAAYLGLVDTPIQDAIALSLEPRAIRSTDEIVIEQSLFWDTFQLPDGPRFHFRSGETNQFQASVILVRDEKIGIAVLSNAAHLADHTLESDVGFPLTTQILKKRRSGENGIAK